jgi:hypothetical protein
MRFHADRAGEGQFRASDKGAVHFRIDAIARLTGEFRRPVDRAAQRDLVGEGDRGLHITFVVVEFGGVIRGARIKVAGDADIHGDRAEGELEAAIEVEFEVGAAGAEIDVRGPGARVRARVAESDVEAALDGRALVRL